jgi:hypothetical protein
MNNKRICKIIFIIFCFNRSCCICNVNRILGRIFPIFKKKLEDL